MNEVPGAWLGNVFDTGKYACGTQYYPFIVMLLDGFP